MSAHVLRSLVDVAMRFNGLLLAEVVILVVHLLFGLQIVTLVRGHDPPSKVVLVVGLLQLQDEVVRIPP